MTATAPLFDLEVRVPADNGLFILNNSHLDGTDTLGGPVEVRRNLCTNPNFETNSVGWSGDGTAGTRARVNTVAALTGFCFKDTLSVNGSSGFVTTTPRPAVSPGDIMTASASVVTDSIAGRTLRISGVWYDSAGVYLSLFSINQVSATAGVAYRLAATGTAPAGAAFFGVQVILMFAVTGESVAIDNVLIEKSPTVNDYFDGDTSPDSDLTPSWLGPVNASQSVLYAAPEGFEWVSVKSDATVVETWRGARVDGPAVEVEVGTLSVSTLIDPAAFAVSDLKPGTLVRLRAAGAHTDTLATLSLDNARVNERKGQPRAELTATSTDAVKDLANTIRYGAATAAAEGEPWPSRVARLMGSATVPVHPPTDEPLVLTMIDHAPAAEVGLWSPGAWSLATIQGIPTYRRTGFDISTRALTGLTPGLIYRVEVALAADDAEITIFRGATWDDYDAAVASGESQTHRLDPIYGGIPSAVAVFEFVATSTTENLGIEAGSTFGIAGLRLIERQRVAWCSNIVTETNLASHLDLATATAGRGWFVDRDGVTRIGAATGPVLAHFSDVHDAGDPLHTCYTDITPSYGTEDVVNDLTLTNITRTLNEVGDDWLDVQTSIGPFVDRVSAAKWGRRSAALETCIYIPPTGAGGYWYADTGLAPVYVGGAADYTDTAEYLATGHLTRLAQPRPRFRSITFNAVDYPDLIAALDVYAHVNVTRSGRTQVSSVISIAHTITPSKWVTTLGLLEED